jgi:hypothetical protein
VPVDCQFFIRSANRITEAGRTVQNHTSYYDREGRASHTRSKSVVISMCYCIDGQQRNNAAFPRLRAGHALQVNPASVIFAVFAGVLSILCLPA